MKERPILFSAPMVRAILAGTKTQTRRVVRKQFAPDAIVAEVGATTPEGWQVSGHSGLWWADAGACLDDAVRCPYGQPGDQLWVREAWDFLPDSAGDEPNAALIVYWATGSSERRLVPDGFKSLLYGHEKRRPSIHMPRWACRITLEVTDVRVERLQSISIGDCIAEGIPRGGPENPDGIERREYRKLWECINGPGSWDANPWVWVVSFKRIEEGSKG